MRRIRCASVWPRATANLLSITAALALGTSGCSKSSAVTKLPEASSGTAAIEADEQAVAQKREEALAGGNKKPGAGSGSASGRTSIDDSTAQAPTRPEKRPAGPTTIDRSGLAQSAPEGPAATPRRPAAPRTVEMLEAPEVAGTTRPGPDVARRPATPDHEGVVRSNQIAGASWAGTSTKQQVAPISREMPGHTDLDFEEIPQRKPLAKGPAADPSQADPAKGAASRTLASRGAARPNTPARTSDDGVAVAKLAARETAAAPRSSASQTRFQVDRLMSTSRVQLSQGELFSAYRTALLAERVAARENVPFSGEEEQPGDLVRLIDREIQLAGVESGRSSRHVASSAPETSADTGEVAAAFGDASSRFAAWRSEDEVRGGLKVRTASDVRSSGFASLDRKPFEAERTIARTPSLPEPSWKTDSSPVVLSSAIATDDNFPPKFPSNQIVPAIEEQADLRPLGSPKGLDAPLLVPSLELPAQVVESGSLKQDLALATGGPLLPKAGAASSAVDSIWDEELVQSGTPGESKLGRILGWGVALAGVASVLLFGLVRRARAARRGS